MRGTGMVLVIADCDVSVMHFLTYDDRYLVPRFSAREISHEFIENLLVGAISAAQMRFSENKVSVADNSTGN